MTQRGIGRRLCDGRKRPSCSRHNRGQLIELKKRDGNRCRGCGVRHRLTRDHVIPWGRGGSNKLANLVLLCEDCNGLKGDLLPHEPGWPPVLERLRVELLRAIGGVA